MTGQQGGLFLSENEYYVDENKKVVLCNSEKKDNLFRKRYKLTHGDKCYSIIKYFCPEVEFISIKIMETGERGRGDLLEIFVDPNMIEIYANNGEYVLSQAVYGLGETFSYEMEKKPEIYLWNE